jgi:Arc/MetJ-type ribon-helix-helix transcriptional regulator
MFDDLKKIAVTRTYSLTAGHTESVKQMADELTEREGRNVSEGEVVRRAIDLLWASMHPETSLPHPDGAQVVPDVSVSKQSFTVCSGDERRSGHNRRTAVNE